MSENRKRKDKQTIIVEDIENGVRLTVSGPPYLVSTGDSSRNLSTHDIGEVWLSNFAPEPGEDRAAYSAKHCTDTGSLHGNSTKCDGVCHDLNCVEPADFFHHWKGEDGKERCIPLCKFHGREMSHYVGRAVLWALEYAVVEDLRFWTQQDTLPGGLPRCEYGYYATDSDGDSARARCTNPATTKVRVTETGLAGEVYEANVCDACAERESNKSGVANGDYTRRTVQIL